MFRIIRRRHTVKTVKTGFDSNEVAYGITSELGAAIRDDTLGAPDTLWTYSSVEPRAARLGYCVVRKGQACRSWVTSLM